MHSRFAFYNQTPFGKRPTGHSQWEFHITAPIFDLKYLIENKKNIKGQIWIYAHYENERWTVKWASYWSLRLDNSGKFLSAGCLGVSQFSDLDERPQSFETTREKRPDKKVFRTGKHLQCVKHWLGRSCARKKHPTWQKRLCCFTLIQCFKSELAW